MATSTVKSVLSRGRDDFFLGYGKGKKYKGNEEELRTDKQKEVNNYG